MKVSVFTPFHKKGINFLHDLYGSLNSQTYEDWEWVLVPNGEGLEADLTDLLKDDRVRSFPYNPPVLIDSDKPDTLITKIGALKKYACDHCRGDILIEVDWDDLLVPEAIHEVVEAFSDHPDVGFVYSNALYTDMNFGKREKFDPSMGWEYRETEYRGHLLDEPITFPLSPSTVSRIWFAPDHLRAFTREAYAKSGGYDETMHVLDDQDLMCRMYLITNFHHIDKGLYVYRVHGDNSWLQHNKEIQDGVYPLYNRYIEQLALKWAKDMGLGSYDLGGRLNKVEGYVSVDLKDAEIIADLNDTWPFEDGSVGVIRSCDIFEHLTDPLHTMKELFRVLAPGGYAFIQVPSTDGRGAFQDPTHKSFWNENSFLYYTDRNWSQYIDTPVRFQAIRLLTSNKNEQGVCWTVAHLLKLSEGLKVPGRVMI